jgi:hypothetical protein
MNVDNDFRTFVVTAPVQSVANTTHTHSLVHSDSPHFHKQT